MSINDLRVPPGNRLEKLAGVDAKRLAEGIAKGSTVFVLTINGESALFGRMRTMLQKLK